MNAAITESVATETPVTETRPERMCVACRSRSRKFHKYGVVTCTHASARPVAFGSFLSACVADCAEARS
jgi:hypothetical protein